MAVLGGIEIRVDPHEVLDLLRDVKQGAARAITRTINRSLATVQTAVGREIARDTSLPVREVRKSLALSRATFQRLIGSVQVTGRRIPLLAFRARQTRRGVSYRLRGSRTIASAFLATMRSGHRGVFKRVAKARLPIRELRGPSLPHVASQRAITGAMLRVGHQAIEKNLLHEVQFLLERRGGG